MEKEMKIISWPSITKGLITEDFVFHSNSYSYVERSMNTPADRRYSVDFMEDESTKTSCSMSINNGQISISISGLSLKNGYFPNYLSSKIDPMHCSVIGDEDDDFRIAVISLPDLSSNIHNHIRVELKFEKNKLNGIGFNISRMDGNFHVYETILDLDYFDF